MVTGDVGGSNAADDLGDGVLEERDTVRRPAIADSKLGLGFGCLIRLREIDGNGLLVLLQNVDAEQKILLEQRQEMAALVDADQSQKWIERNRRERIGGHAVCLAGIAGDGDDAHAGGELA